MDWNVCRICLKEGFLVSVYDDIDEDHPEETIANCIMSCCTSITVRIQLIIYTYGFCYDFIGVIWSPNPA